jgi:hypothetical protein
MNYVHDLHDEDQPDYQRLRKMLDKLFREQEFERDKVFDWTIREFQMLEPAAQVPLASNCMEKGRGANIAKPLGSGAQDVTKATRRKRR